MALPQSKTWFNRQWAFPIPTSAPYGTNISIPKGGGPILNSTSLYYHYLKTCCRTHLTIPVIIITPSVKQSTLYVAYIVFHYILLFSTIYWQKFTGLVHLGTAFDLPPEYLNISRWLWLCAGSFSTLYGIPHMCSDGLGFIRHLKLNNLIMKIPHEITQILGRILVSSYTYSLTFLFL